MKQVVLIHAIWKIKEILNKSQLKFDNQGTKMKSIDAVLAPLMTTLK